MEDLPKGVPQGVSPLWGAIVIGATSVWSSDAMKLAPGTLPGSLCSCGVRACSLLLQSVGGTSPFGECQHGLMS